MEKKIKIYTWYDPPLITPEVNTEPSLTDDSFFEPLNVLVQKILRGESTTLGDSTAAMFEYDGEQECDFDATESDFAPDDLTDIDISREAVKGYRSATQVASSQGATESSDATVSNVNHGSPQGSGVSRSDGAVQAEERLANGANVAKAE